MYDYQLRGIEYSNSTIDYLEVTDEDSNALVKFEI